LSGGDASVWVLLGKRTGDNNQLLRLAGELGVPFRTIELRYNALHLLPPPLLGASFSSLTEEARRALQPPWPQLVLGIGHRSVSVALEISKRSGGQSKLVRLGNPRLQPGNFDLVITTPQYRVPSARNVLRLPIAINTAPPTAPIREESKWLAGLPRPHRLLLVGGKTFMWSLPASGLAAAARKIAGKDGGSTIAVASGRTDKAAMEAVAASLKATEHAVIGGRFPRYPVLLADADEIYVTADSVAMISDAIATGKPVGLVEPEQTTSGRLFYAASRWGAGVPVRDVRRFWTSVRDAGLVGSVENPRAGKLHEEPLAMAITAVKRLMQP
jgi:mitochondrial fission protein ELM1